MALRIPAFNDAKTYGFEWLRNILEAALQEGVVAAGDYKAAAAAAGGQRVDVAAGTALVKGDSGAPGTGLSHGLFLVVNDASIANALTLPASNATLPRLDQIILRVRDTADLGSTADDAVLEIVTGVATAGVTLDNRTGAGSLPNDAIRLADVLVPAASTAVTAGNIRDRRSWARGALSSGVSTVNLAGTNGGATQIVPVTQRIECSGAPLDLLLKHGLLQLGSGGPIYALRAQLMVDGILAWEPVTPTNTGVAASTYGTVTPASHRTIYTPSPGSHLFVFQFALDNQSVAGQALNAPFELAIAESVRQNASNN